MIIELEGITGRKSFEPKPFPENELELGNGQRLRAVKDYPFLGLTKGDVFQIWWDGEMVRSGGLSWSVAGLIEEIRLELWDTLR